MSCPRCKIGHIEGGTGCLCCDFCQSVYDLEMNYRFTYKTEEQRMRNGVVYDYNLSAMW